MATLVDKGTTTASDNRIDYVKLISELLLLYRYEHALLIDQ
jgi:hypothetical protein